MTDYLLKFDSAEDCDLPQPEEGNPPCWTIDGKTFMPVIVITSEAVYDTNDPEDPSDGPDLLSPQEVASGVWYVVVSTDDYTHDAIIDWPECPGRVSPTFAGREYPQ